MGARPMGMPGQMMPGQLPTLQVGQRFPTRPAPRPIPAGSSMPVNPILQQPQGMNALRARMGIR